MELMESTPEKKKAVQTSVSMPPEDKKFIEQNSISPSKVIQNYVEEVRRRFKEAGK